MKADWRDKEWRYQDAETTRRPGYLASRFKEIRRKQREGEEQAKATVTQMRAKK